MHLFNAYYIPNALLYILQTLFYLLLKLFQWPLYNMNNLHLKHSNYFKTFI